jgi:polysaccharide deacetylase
VRIDDLARRALVSASRARGPLRPRPDGEPLRFLFTIDTEISMGGSARDPSLRPVGAARRIWGETASGPCGITRFMDVFEAHGMKGVFFFEPVARRIVGEDDLADAARAIADRGHDVELHVHPEFDADLHRVQRGEAKTPAAMLHAHPLEAQRRYIRESAAAIERWTKRRPIAFRAGGYSADETTLEALKAEGMFVDSSYNAWANERRLSGFARTPRLNDAAMIEGGILEVPVTNLVARGPLGGLRPFELSALSASEMIAALDQLHESGARTVCAVTHSFRLVRTTNVQYTDAVPDLVNLHRLEALCRHLSANPDRFKVVTFRDLPFERWRGLGPAPEPYFPTPPVWSSLARQVVQAVKDRRAV